MILALTACGQEGNRTQQQSHSPDKPATLSVDQRPPPYQALLEYNARQVAVPEDERAWPPLFDAVTRAFETDDWREFADASDSSEVDVTQPWLSRNHEIVADLIAALQRDHLGLPYAWTYPPEIEPDTGYKIYLPGDTPPPLVSVPMTSARYERAAARILRAHARDENLPIDDAIETLAALRKLVEYERAGFLIECLVNASLVSRLCDAATIRAADPDLTDDQLQRLAATVPDPHDRLNPLAERDQAIDFITRAYGNESSLSRNVYLRISRDLLEDEDPDAEVDRMFGMLELAQNLGRLSGIEMKIASRSEELTQADRYFDALDNIFIIPPWEALADTVWPEIARTTTPKSSDPQATVYPVLFLATGFTAEDPPRMHAIRWTTTARAHTVLSVMRHRAITGELPESLDDIPQETRTGDLRHGMTGKPIPYEHTDTGFRFGYQDLPGNAFDAWDINLIDGTIEAVPSTPEPTSPGITKDRERGTFVKE